MKKHNIISDWLDKYGDPVIDEKVEKEIKRINNMKQTAVEWLVGEVELISNSTGVSKEERIELYNNAIEKAKQMEFKEKEESYLKGFQDGKQYQIETLK